MNNPSDPSAPRRPLILRAVDITACILVFSVGGAIALAFFGLLARLIVSAWNFGYHLLP